MDTYQGNNCCGSYTVESSMSDDRYFPKNKFIFVKHNSQNITKGSTILVNPRFKDNTKVFINPNFPTKAVNDIVISRPHIFVNPKLINSISSSSNSDIQNISPVNRNPLKSLPTDTSGRVLISTKNKLIKVPEIKSNNSINSIRNFSKIINSSENLKKVITTNSRVLISTKNKFIRISQSKTNPKLPIFSNSHKNIVSTSHIYKKVNRSPKKLKSSEHCKLSKTKIMSSGNKSFQTHSTNTRFRYVKTGIMKKLDNTVIRSRHKIVNNINTNKILGQRVASNSTNFRKKFVYVNKFNSSSFLANNVILKNTKQRGFININGILYQNSPSKLKKTNMSIRKHKDSQNLCSFRSSQPKSGTIKISPKFKRIYKHMIMENEGRYKIVGSRAAASTLRKSNVPCPIFKKYGKCNGQKKGTCIKVHNSDQIVLCSKFLRGACLKKNCLLSHKVSPEKMPTCKFFLEGLCARDDCQYLHVKISPKADICKDFLDGFCKAGTKCEKRHQLLCPEYEKYQKCVRKKCEYPHISKDTYGEEVSKKLAKATKRRKTEVIKENVVETMEKPNIRYYIEVENEGTNEALISERPKLGSLPSFIPFSEVS